MSFSEVYIAELRQNWLWQNERRLASNHECITFNCALQPLAPDLYICPLSANIHCCGARCDNAEENEGRLTCRYTAMVIPDTLITRHSGLTEWTLRHDEFRGERLLASDLTSALDSVALQCKNCDSGLQASRIADRVCLKTTSSVTVTRSIYELINIVMLRFLSERSSDEVNRESREKITREKDLILMAALSRQTTAYTPRQSQLSHTYNTLSLAEDLSREVDEKRPRMSNTNFHDQESKQLFATGVSTKILHILWTVIEVDAPAIAPLFFKYRSKRIRVNEAAIAEFTLMCLFIWFPIGLKLRLNNGQTHCLLREQQFFAVYQGQRAVRLPKILAGFEVLTKVSIRSVNGRMQNMDKQLRGLLLAALNSHSIKHNETEVKFRAIDTCSDTFSLNFNDFAKGLYKK